MDIEDKTELENEALDEQPMDETLEGVEDAQVPITGPISMDLAATAS